VQRARYSSAGFGWTRPLKRGPPSAGATGIRKSHASGSLARQRATRTKAELFGVEPHHDRRCRLLQKLVPAKSELILSSIGGVTNPSSSLPTTWRRRHQTSRPINLNILLHHLSLFCLFDGLADHRFTFRVRSLNSSHIASATSSARALLT
jgi:hypothetical protein